VRGTFVFNNFNVTHFTSLQNKINSHKYAFTKKNVAVPGLMKSKYFADAVINKEGGEEIISNHITEAAPRNKNIALPSNINMKL
jgi:hypothetical protein